MLHYLIHFTVPGVIVSRCASQVMPCQLHAIAFPMAVPLKSTKLLQLHLRGSSVCKMFNHAIWHVCSMMRFVESPHLQIPNTLCLQSSNSSGASIALFTGYTIHHFSLVNVSAHCVGSIMCDMQCQYGFCNWRILDLQLVLQSGVQVNCWLQSRRRLRRIF